jgi:hypothetical protein
MSTDTTIPSADDTHITGPFKWSELPTELQLMVLRHRVILPKALTAESHPSHSRRVLLPLILTSKRMRELACPIYYGENEFKLSRRARRGGGVATESRSALDRRAHYIMAYPQPSVGTLIRILEVDLAVNIKRGPNLYAAFKIPTIGDWAWLFVAKNKPKLEHLTEWQKAFPALCRLKIVLNFDDYSACLKADGEVYPVDRLTGMLDAMARVRIPIQAASIEVDVRGVHCEPTKHCDGRCSQTLAAAIVGMVNITAHEELLKNARLKNGSLFRV